MIDRDLTIYMLDQSSTLNRMEVRPTPDSCSDRMEKHRMHLRYKLGGSTTRFAMSASPS